METVYYDHNEMKHLSELFQCSADEMKSIQDLLVSANSIAEKCQVDNEIIRSINSILDNIPHYLGVLNSLSDEAQRMSQLFKPAPPLDY